LSSSPDTTPTLPSSLSLHAALPISFAALRYPTSVGEPYRCVFPPLFPHLRVSSKGFRIGERPSPPLRATSPIRWGHPVGPGDPAGGAGLWPGRGAPRCKEKPAWWAAQNPVAPRLTR